MNPPHAHQRPGHGPTSRQDRRIDTSTAARIAGVKASTWRAWRTQGRPRPEPAPEPDGWWELRTPWWWESTVVAWARRRREALTPAPASLLGHLAAPAVPTRAHRPAERDH